MYVYAQNVSGDCVSLETALRDLGWSAEHEEALTAATDRQRALEASMHQMTVLLQHTGGDATVTV